MVDVDYSKLKSIADEQHWNEFIPTAGGELVAPLIKRQRVQNADYLFRASRVVAELKVLETEFAHTTGTLEKVSALLTNYGDESRQNFRPELTRVLEAPLQRILKKANRQIRETKDELGLTGYRGVIICINDGFRRIRPETVRILLSDILAKESFSSAQCLIYQTNHYVEIAESPGAVLLWAPLYSPKASDDLVEFVNELGRAWRRYLHKTDGPFDFSGEYKDIDWSRTHVVKGVWRQDRYIRSDK
jgi:hypothetical protein